MAASFFRFHRLTGSGLRGGGILDALASPQLAGSELKPTRVTHVAVRGRHTAVALCGGAGPVLAVLDAVDAGDAWGAAGRGGADGVRHVPEGVMGALIYSLGLAHASPLPGRDGVGARLPPGMLVHAFADADALVAVALLGLQADGAGDVLVAVTAAGEVRVWVWRDPREAGGGGWGELGCAALGSARVVCAAVAWGAGGSEAGDSAVLHVVTAQPGGGVSVCCVSLPGGGAGVAGLACGALVQLILPESGASVHLFPAAAGVYMHIMSRAGSQLLHWGAASGSLAALGACHACGGGAAGRSRCQCDAAGAVLVANVSHVTARPGSPAAVVLSGDVLAAAAVVGAAIELRPLCRLADAGLVLPQRGFHMPPGAFVVHRHVAVFRVASPPRIAVFDALSGLLLEVRREPRVNDAADDELRPEGGEDGEEHDGVGGDEGCDGSDGGAAGRGGALCLSESRAGVTHVVLYGAASVWKMRDPRVSEHARLLISRAHAVGSSVGGGGSGGGGGTAGSVGLSAGGFDDDRCAPPRLAGGPRVRARERVAARTCCAGTLTPRASRGGP